MRLREDVEWCKVDGQVVVIDLQTSACVAINRSGAALWPALVGGASEEQLQLELVERFGISSVSACRDVSIFLGSLRERRLLDE